MVKSSSKKKKIRSIGPSDDCDCPVCIFVKSQAPGDPYDLTKCAKYNAKKKIDKKDK